MNEKLKELMKEKLKFEKMGLDQTIQETSE